MNTHIESGFCSKWWLNFEIKATWNMNTDKISSRTFRFIRVGRSKIIEHFKSLANSDISWKKLRNKENEKKTMHISNASNKYRGNR